MVVSVGGYEKVVCPENAWELLELMLATQRLLNLKLDDPRSLPRSVSGSRKVPLAILPTNVKESEVAFPKVTLPLASSASVKVVPPVTSRAPPAVKFPEKDPVPITSSLWVGEVVPIPTESVEVVWKIFVPL